MSIQILCVGSLKEKYWKASSEEYIKRLKKYCAIQIEEVKEVRGENPDTVKLEESKALLNRCRKDSYIIALDVAGRELNSEQFADMLARLELYGNSRICFVIGGSYGLSDVILDNANVRLSFSKMTFPHQMMRTVLLEQIYRAFKINSNEVYHK